MTRVFQSVLLALIKAYQYILSPIVGPKCKFYPSCSSYAAEAISRHGALQGLYMAICRIGRCHPFSRGGYDPVPEKKGCEKACPCGETKQS